VGETLPITLPMREEVEVSRELVDDCRGEMPESEKGSSCCSAAAVLTRILPKASRIMVSSSSETRLGAPRALCSANLALRCSTATGPPSSERKRVNLRVKLCHNMLADDDEQKRKGGGDGG